ncbi:UNVERIFIED_CONTAM: hypothetical protein FKN15_077390 [Acipenser sinensis]
MQRARARAGPAYVVPKPDPCISSQNVQYPEEAPAGRAQHYQQCKHSGAAYRTNGSSYLVEPPQDSEQQHQQPASLEQLDASQALSDCSYPAPRPQIPAPASPLPYELSNLEGQGAYSHPSPARSYAEDLLKPSSAAFEHSYPSPQDEGPPSHSYTDRRHVYFHEASTKDCPSTSSSKGNPKSSDKDASTDEDSPASCPGIRSYHCLSVPPLSPFPQTDSQTEIKATALPHKLRLKYRALCNNLEAPVLPQHPYLVLTHGNQQAGSERDDRSEDPAGKEGAYQTPVGFCKPREGESESSEIKATALPHKLRLKYRALCNNLEAPVLPQHPYLVLTHGNQQAGSERDDRSEDPAGKEGAYQTPVGFCKPREGESERGCYSSGSAGFPFNDTERQRWSQGAPSLPAAGIRLAPRPRSLSLGGSLEIVCVAPQEFSGGVFQLFKEQTYLRSVDHRGKEQQEARFTLSPLTRSDEGNYCCRYQALRTERWDNSPFSPYLRITLTDITGLLPMPSLTVWGVTGVLAKGDSVSLECVAPATFPRAHFLLFHGDSINPVSSNQALATQHSVLSATIQT